MNIILLPLSEIDRSGSFFRVFLFIVFILGLSLPVGRAYAADSSFTLPVIDREASEQVFLRAYDFYMKNNLWNCIDDLDKALKLNTYFVDTYYIKSLALRRLGRYPEAMKAMQSYLEVRRNDLRGQMIFDVMNDEWDSIKKSLYPRGVITKLFFEAYTFNKFLNVPVYNPISLKGMMGLGKLTSMGHNLFVCDTLGDTLCLFDLMKDKDMLHFSIKSPVAALPISQSEALLFLKSGDIQRVKINFAAASISSKPEGKVNANVSDAAFIDSSLVAVADRTGQSVRFFGVPGFNEVALWRPDDSDTTEKLFEPVALASYGPLLAVADRGNGRVFVLDTYTLSVRDKFDAELPRDLEWGNQGELYVLTERGELYSRYPVGSKSKELKLEVSGMRDAWSLTWTDDGPTIANISGRIWWSSSVYPGFDGTFGTISLYEPWIKKDKNVSTLFLRGAVASAFKGFLNGENSDVQAVWRNEVRPSRIVETDKGHRGETFFYSPSPAQDGSVKVRHASSIKDVMADVSKMSRSGDVMPGVVVLDTNITFGDGEQVLFYSFLLRQGIRLDLLAADRPASTLLTYISRITHGNTYYSRVPEVVPVSSSTEWVIGIPLPPDITTFGYPSEATLSVFATEDSIRFNDWIPIWPALIKKK